MDNEHFPHSDLGGDVCENYLMDVFPLNIDINFQKWHWLKSYIDISSCVRLQDDFYNEEVDDWTNTAAGGSVEVTDMVNGVMLFSPQAQTDDAYAERYQNHETWRLYDAFPMYFEMRFLLSDTDESEFYAGLLDALGYYAAGGNHGVYFRKDDGNASLIFACEDNAVVTDTDTDVNLEAFTWYRIGFHWDGAGNLRWFVFDDYRVCLATGVVTTGFPQDEELRICFGVRNGEADSKFLYVDYFKCVAERYVE